MEPTPVFDQQQWGEKWVFWVVNWTLAGWMAKILVQITETSTKVGLLVVLVGKD